jgi:hypothetical protein
VAPSPLTSWLSPTCHLLLPLGYCLTKGGVRRTIKHLVSKGIPLLSSSVSTKRSHTLCSAWLSPSATRHMGYKDLASSPKYSKWLIGHRKTTFPWVYGKIFSPNIKNVSIFSVLSEWAVPSVVNLG